MPSDFHIFKGNLATLPMGQDLLIAVCLGLSAALLGISGFESSANFVEEQDIQESLNTLRKIYPRLKSNLVARKGKFDSEIIDEVSKEFGVPINNIFIGAPEEKHSFSIQDLGGVRVIF